MVGELAKTALPVVGELAKTVTEAFKVAGKAVDSLTAAQQNWEGQNKIAWGNTHYHNKPVDFSGGNSANSNVSIKIS